MHFECSLALRCSYPGLTFLGEVEEWTGNLEETLNEPAVKVSKSKEGLNIFDVSRFWPLYNIGSLDGVYVECIVRDDKSNSIDSASKMHFSGLA